MFIVLILNEVFACIRYECVSLDSSICAKKAKNSILVNSVGCSDGMWCLADSLAKLEDNGLDTLYCNTASVYPSYNWNNVLYKCGERLGSKNFINGGTLVECIIDSDCLLQDGNHTICQCGADGKKYCVPAWDSVVFDQYWNECKLGISRNRMDFWLLFKEFYPVWYTGKSLGCLVKTIYEIQVLSNNDLQESSFGLALSVIFLLFL